MIRLLQQIPQIIQIRLKQKSQQILVFVILQGEASYFASLRAPASIMLASIMRYIASIDKELESTTYLSIRNKDHKSINGFQLINFCFGKGFCK